MRARRLRWGVAAAAAYVIVAAVSFDAGLFPIRPLYEGTVPAEPYRFVDPPPGVADNQPPASAREEFTVDEAREGGTIVTDDQQAFVIFELDGIALPDGIEGVVVTIDPLDPYQIGPPPEDLDYDGNAYRIEARYQPSGEPVELAADATVLLRYPFAATGLYRRDGDSWTQLEVNTGGSLEFVVFTDRLGLFVAAGLGMHRGGGGIASWIYAAAGLLVVGGGVGLGGYRRARQRRAERRRQMGKKGKRPSKGS